MAGLAKHLLVSCVDINLIKTVKEDMFCIFSQAEDNLASKVCDMNDIMFGIISVHSGTAWTAPGSYFTVPTPSKTQTAVLAGTMHSHECIEGSTLWRRVVLC